MTVSAPDPAPAAAAPSPRAVLVRWGQWWQHYRPWLFGGLALALALAVGLTLQRLLGEVQYAGVMRAVEATPTLDIALALLATAISFLALSRYDASSLRYAGAKRVGEPTVLLTSFVAYALANTIGLGPLSGGAVRMRLYAAAGIEPPVIARMIVFNAVAFGLGITTFGALALLWGAGAVAAPLRLSAPLLRGLAALALLGLGVLLWLCAARRHLRFGRRFVKLPPLRLALAQLAISAFELAASAAALWFLLPHGQIDLPSFVAFYALAITAGIISHVPGGVGVFEAVMLIAAGGSVPSDAMLGALLLYRGLYYVLPLLIASALLVGWELRSGVAAPVGRMAVHLSPRLMAALALVAGIWLMASGATPFTEDAREMLEMLNVPLPLIEASHFLGSVAGLGLLLVARGLLHQLDAAWWAALVLSLVAAVLALPKGIALNEAAFLSVLALLLVISRRQFDRRSSLFSQHLEPPWLIALAGVVIACVWVLFFAYREVAYNNHLWWEFELNGQAPRSLRAMMAIALIALGYSLWQLLRPPTRDPAQPSAAEIERAAAIVRANPSSDGCYAYTADKHLMFSPSGKSFLMFGKQGRSWVSLFGPFGERREWADLVWQFIETAGDHGARAAFYQVRPATLPLYLDVGLHALKLGEYAQVPLPGFNLKGAKRQNLRSGVNRGEREGLVFEVIPPGQVSPLLTELREVSDAWLAKQRGREKRFSVGRFDPAYLMRLPIAVVRREGRVIAFANLLLTEAKDEASLDLMRHAPDSPPGTMDFLFAKIMLHLQAEGYQRFGLGMSPMAGMAERRRAPRWQRLGKLLFQYGDRFYNFRGLHSFKDKFEPVWEARYLAAPRGLTPMFVLADVATLIGGSPKGGSGR